MSESDDILKQLHALTAECDRLRIENLEMRRRLGREDVNAKVAKPEIRITTKTHGQLSAEQKIALFRSLFRGREDVYAMRWIGKDGKAGYSPAGIKNWQERDEKGRPKTTPVALTNEAVQEHLQGRQTLGVYPLLKDETCFFLAADFDKGGWREDAGAYLRTCQECGVPAVLERSRSGKGGHVWVFFEEAIPASMARKLGAAMLTHTMDRRHQVGLDSYDRFFPNQDTLPKGGFGNLIAMPLQAGPRRDGNSVFLDEHFQPHEDQWAFLSSVKKMRIEQVQAVIAKAEASGGIIGLRLSNTEEDQGDPWLQRPSRRKLDAPIEEPLPKEVRVVRGNLVYVEKAGMPSAMLNRLLRIAAFQNPEFYKAQAMRLSTFGKPRVIRCGEEFAQFVALPRGCFDEVMALLTNHRVKANVQDERFVGIPIDTSFHGTLRDDQEASVKALSASDDGILSATTAFGKTVVAAQMIAVRKVNTLVLVHRRQLLDQWRERLAAFLNLDAKDIGVISGGKIKPTKRIDIAVIQSLNKKGEVNDLVAEYGHVIVDECHHLSAFSFEQVMRQVKAKHVLGLTATPVRKDGHQPIIFMQCGPIRFHVDARKQAAERPFDHIVLPRPTMFRLPPTAEPPAIQDTYRMLVDDTHRNELIAADVLAAVSEGRSPLILTERKQHAQLLADSLAGKASHIIVLTGGKPDKQRRILAEQLAAIPDGAPRILIATGRYIGEGFDDARLDTLFLALPISWRGTLQQYVGRLHRLHASKREVRVYDYVDDAVPMLSKMYQKRCGGYQAIGYVIKEDLSSEAE